MTDVQWVRIVLGAGGVLFLVWDIRAIAQLLEHNGDVVFCVTSKLREAAPLIWQPNKSVPGRFGKLLEPAIFFERNDKQMVAVRVCVERQQQKSFVHQIAADFPQRFLAEFLAG